MQDVVRHFGEDLDQLLAGDMDARIRHHLDNCPNCEAYTDSLKKVIKLFRRCPRPRLGSNVRTRLHTIIPLTY